MKKPIKVIAVFLAYNAAKTLKKFYETLPKENIDDFLLVDDMSQDQTLKVAGKLRGLRIYKNKTNLGYGGNLKRAISLALEAGADIVIDIHPDGEYLPSAIKPALNLMKKGGYDLILGNRFSTPADYFNNGMFGWKIIPVILLNSVCKVCLGIKLHDLHQGFRLYNKSLFAKVDISDNSNGFLFSFELIAQAVFTGCKLAEIPVKTKYQGPKRGATFVNSVKYAFGVFAVLAKFMLAKFGFKNIINNS